MDRVVYIVLIEDQAGTYFEEVSSTEEIAKDVSESLGIENRIITRFIDSNYYTD